VKPDHFTGQILFLPPGQRCHSTEREAFNKYTDVKHIIEEVLSCHQYLAANICKYYITTAI